MKSRKNNRLPALVKSNLLISRVLDKIAVDGELFLRDRQPVVLRSGERSGVRLIGLGDLVVVLGCLAGDVPGTWPVL